MEPSEAARGVAAEQVGARIGAAPAPADGDAAAAEQVPPSALSRRSFVRRGALAAGAAGGAAVLGAAAVAPTAASAAYAPGPDDFRVSDFGAVGDGRTDDTAAIQRAIDAAYAHAAAGAGHGRVLFDAKTYVIAGAPRRPIAATYETAGQLVIPLRSSGSMVNVELVGAGTQQGKQDLDVGDEQPGGTCLRSTVSPSWGGHGTGMPPAVISVPKGPDWGGFNRVTVAIHGIAIRVPDNPSISGLNLWWAPQVRLSSVRVDTPEVVYRLAEPTRTHATGIVLPYVNNNAVVYLRDVHVSGFWTGIVFGEHTDASSVLVFGCKVALAPFGIRAHTARFGLLTVEWCTAILSQIDWEIGRVPCGGENLVIDLLDVEEYNGYQGRMGWAAQEWHVYDPNSKMYGWIKMARSSPGIPLAVSGGRHLKIEELHLL